LARGIIVNLGGEISEFEIGKVDREKLYGRKVRMVVDDAGGRCEPALLSRDGSCLMPPGSVALLYVDDAFDAVERGELKAVDLEGKPVAPVPSTLGAEQPLTGPVDAARVLDHVTTAVYQLSPTTLGDGLRQRLDAGEIFETTFNYREDFDASPLFLLKNEGGFFALVSAPTHFEFLTKDAAPPPPVAEEASDDEDLDFSMM